MRRADRDSQRVYAGLRNEVDNLFGFGVVRFLCHNVVFNASKNAQLAFNGYVELVCIVNNLLRQGHVFVVGK